MTSWKTAGHTSPSPTTQGRELIPKCCADSHMLTIAWAHTQQKHTVTINYIKYLKECQRTASHTVNVGKGPRFVFTAVDKTASLSLGS